MTTSPEAEVDTLPRPAESNNPLLSNAFVTSAGETRIASSGRAMDGRRSMADRRKTLSEELFPIRRQAIKRKTSASLRSLLTVRASQAWFAGSPLTSFGVGTSPGTYRRHKVSLRYNVVTMAALENLLGSNPRTKVAEALIRLGDIGVSRADVAREAGLFRASTNRVLKDFEKQGIVIRVGEGKRPLIQANLDSPYLLLLARFEAALELVDLTETKGLKNTAPAHPVLTDFTNAVRQVTITVSSGAGSTFISAPSPGGSVRKVTTA